jgi:GTPase SAR1 family protein
VTHLHLLFKNKNIKTAIINLTPYKIMNKSNLSKNPINIIISGASSIGKSKFVNILINKSCVHYTHNTPTSGIDIQPYVSQTNQNCVFWDLSGKERYNHIVENYFHRGDIILIGFNNNSIESIENFNSWISIVQNNNLEKFIGIINLSHNLPTIPQKIKKICDENNFKCYNTHWQNVEMTLTEILTDFDHEHLQIHKNNDPPLNDFQEPLLNPHPDSPLYEHSYQKHPPKNITTFLTIIKNLFCINQ